MRTYKITTFANVRTTLGTPEELTLQQLAECLTGMPRVNADKLAAECFVPGHFVDNTRSKKNLQLVSCLIYDFDGENHGALRDAEIISILETLQSMAVVYILYSTYNNGLRVVFPLAEDIAPGEYAALYDAVAGRFGVQPDKTGRQAERLHFLPSVPSESAVSRFMSEANLGGECLTRNAFMAEQKPETKGAFAGLQLSKVRVGTVDTLEALTAALASSTAKQADLNRYVFGLAKSAAQQGKDKQSFADTLWPAAEAGLRANANPVENWKLALATCERAIEQAYTKVDTERAEAIATIPAGVRKTADKLVKEGRLAETGKLLGKYVTPVLTASVLVEAFSADIEESDGVVSIPDAVEQLRESIESNTRVTWQEGLTVDDKGNFAGTDLNVDRVLRNHPDVQGKLLRDVRLKSERAYADAMPWGAPKGAVENPEADHVAFFEWICNTLHPAGSAQMMPAGRARDRLNAAFDGAPQHDSFRDEYLASLVWDGTPRLGSWLVDIGCEDDEYTRMVGRKFLVSAVARTFDPGCQVDNVLVLVGAQGQNKSRAVRALVPNKDLYGNVKNLTDREVAVQMSRWVLAFIDEIERWASKKAAGELKEFVTTVRSDTRTAYARTERAFERRAVLIGATNHEDYLFDETGARRWWSVNVTRDLDIDMLTDMRDQLWAEAVHARLTGETWWLSKEEQQLALPKQETLFKAEQTAESECLLERMKYLPQGQRCPLRTDPSSRGDKIPVSDDQMDGDGMRWMTRSQAAAILRVGGFRNDDRTVKDAMKRAGLKRNKANDRFYLPDSKS